MSQSTVRTGDFWCWFHHWEKVDQNFSSSYRKDSSIRWAVIRVRLVCLRCYKIVDKEFKVV